MRESKPIRQSYERLRESIQRMSPEVAACQSPLARGGAFVLDASASREEWSRICREIERSGIEV